jgi:serine-type D-Ala-D-Ala carboxypeptidase
MENQVDAQIRKRIDILVEKELKRPLFSGCSVGYHSKRGQGLIYHYGRTGFEVCDKLVDDETLYDLASLTKPLVISLSLLVLLEAGKIRFEDPLSLFYGTRHNHKDTIRIDDLLNHCSGLPAHHNFYEKLVDYPVEERKRVVVEMILAQRSQYPLQQKEIYSDLGFILLGDIVEKVSRQRLDIFWKETICRPLGLEKGLFFPKIGGRSGESYMSTGVCRWAKEKLSGRVHDDNCRAMGGVAGHAGLFGTTGALLALCKHVLQQISGEADHPAYSAQLLRGALLSGKGRAWTCGFDSPHPTDSSSGHYFSSVSRGHLGFTGTSFWIDPRQQMVIVLLTNRVLCGENREAIKSFRAAVHDAIMRPWLPPVTERRGQHAGGE